MEVASKGARLDCEVRTAAGREERKLGAERGVEPRTCWSGGICVRKLSWTSHKPAGLSLIQAGLK